MAKKKSNPNEIGIPFVQPAYQTDNQQQKTKLTIPISSDGESCKPQQQTNDVDNIIKNIKDTKKQSNPNTVPVKKEKNKNTKSIITSKKPQKQVIKKSSAPTVKPTIVDGGSKKQNLNKNKKGGSDGGGGEGGGTSVSGGEGGGGGGSGGGGASPGLSLNATPHGKKTKICNCCNGCREEDCAVLFNKVKQTESGHVVEFDDSPGSERLHVMHRSGTNFEVLPRGSFAGTVVTDGWLSFYRDLWVHVDGFTNLTFDKGVKIIVNKDEIKNEKEKNVNFDIKILGKANINLHLEGGNLNIKLDDGDVNLNMEDGDLNVRTMGNYNHYVDGDYNLHVSGDMHTVIDGDRLEEVTGNKEDIIYDGFYTLDANKGIRQITAKDMEILVDNDYRVTIKNDYMLRILRNEEIYIGNKKSEWIDGKTTIKSKEHQHYSEGNYDITCNATQNYFANAIINLYGQVKVDINGSMPDKASSSPSNTPLNDITKYKQYEKIEKSFKTESRKRDN